MPTSKQSPVDKKKPLPISRAMTRYLTYRDIRKMYNMKRKGIRLYSMADVAEYFGVSTSLVGKICKK